MSSIRPIPFAIVALGLAGMPVGAQLRPTRADFGGSATVTVPFSEVHSLVTIPVSINGHDPIRMILDTGAPIILIPDTALARRLELNIVGQAQVGGAGDGEVQTAPLAVGITARVGSLEVTDATGVTGIAADAIPGVDGVIGAAFFSHAVVEIDWDAHVVRFHDPATNPMTFSGDTLRLDVQPSLHSFVDGVVGVDSATRPVHMHLDTGSRHALSLARATVDDFPVPPDSAIRTVVGYGSRGPARGDAIRTRTLELGGTTLRNVATTVPDREPSGAGRIGLPVLRRFQVVVDYPRRRLILHPRDNRADPFPFYTTGLVLSPGRDSTTRLVIDVMAGTPAAEAGLRVGDVITMVDGRSASTLTESDVDRLVLHPAPGTAVMLTTTSNAGTSRELRLVARTILPG